MIDITKQYQMRDGRPVRILCTDGGGRFPVIGMLGEDLHRWNDLGRFYYWCDPGPFDLVEVPKRIKRTVWVNVYDKTKSTTSYDSREKADDDAAKHYRHLDRIACVRVEIDCAEGEGL
jgi:hypothetical protein